MADKQIGLDYLNSWVDSTLDSVYEELMALPTAMSTKPKQYDAELRSNVESARLQDDFYYVVGERTARVA
jgi:hypothetical protein